VPSTSIWWAECVSRQQRLWYSEWLFQPLHVCDAPGGKPVIPQWLGSYRASRKKVTQGGNKWGARRVRCLHMCPLKSRFWSPPGVKCVLRSLRGTGRAMPLLRSSSRLLRGEKITRADMFDAPSEEVIAQGRIVLCALSLLAIYLDPMQPGTAVRGVVIAY